MNAQQVIEALLEAEVNAKANDARRILSEERNNLMAAVQTKRVTPKKIKDAQEVLEMWKGR